MKTTIKLSHKIFCSGVSFKKYTPVLEAHTDLFEALENTLTKEDRDLIKLESSDSHQCCVDFESKAGLVINRYGKDMCKKIILFFTWNETEDSKIVIINSAFFKVENGYTIKPILCNGVKIKAAKTHEEMMESCNAFTECLHNWFIHIADYLISNKEPFSRNTRIKIYQEEMLPYAKNIIANRKSASSFCGQLYIDGSIYYDRSILFITEENSVPVKEDKVDRVETSKVEEVAKEIDRRNVYAKINKLAKNLTNLIERYNDGPCGQFDNFYAKIDIERFIKEPVVFKISNKGFKYMKIVFDGSEFAGYTFKTKNSQIGIKFTTDSVILRWRPGIPNGDKRNKVKNDIIGNAVDLIVLLNNQSKL